MEALIKALKETDYKLLRNQKKSIVELSEALHKLGSKKYADHLDGTLNFLDAIQDAVVENKIKTERQVFGRLD